MTRILLLVLSGLLAPCFSDAAAAKKDLLAPGQRIVVLGDSNTYAGHYVVFLEAALRQRYPGKKIEILNVGLPSETASGLSEPDHPFPRPTVHERLDRVLVKMKPDVVLACYGMNDGIYNPHSAERLQAYQDGINRLVAKVKKAGAKIVLLTPPPFDPLPLRKNKKLRSADAEKFAWFAPYEDYDKDVLRRYAEWIMKQGKTVDLVVDVRTPTLEHLARERKKDADYVLAKDGVHPNKTGHRLIADAVLKSVKIKPLAKDKQLVLALIAKRQFLLRDAWLTQTGHKRPGIRKGLPLAEAQRQADKLDNQIRELLK